MRKLLFIGFGTLVLLLLVVTVSAIFILPEQLRTRIEAKVNATSGRRLAIGELRLQFLPEPGVTLEGVTFEDTEAETQLTVPRIFATVDWNFSRVGLNLESPEIRMTTKTQDPASMKPESPVSTETMDLTSGLPDRPIAAHVKLTNGKFSWQDAALEKRAEMSGLDVELSFDQVKGPWKIAVSSQNQIGLGAEKWVFPVKLMAVLPEAPLKDLKLTDAKFSVAGLETTIAGEVEYASMRGQFQMKSRIEDLSKLSEIHPALTKQKLAGALTADARVVNADGKGWLASGKVLAQKVQAISDLPFSGGHLKGPVTLDGEVEFSQGNTAGGVSGWSFPLARFVARLDQAELQYESHLRKGAGVPLRLELDSRSDDGALQVKHFRLQLDRLVAEASGRLALKAAARSEFSIQVPRTALEGMEKIFPALAKQPLQGFVELDGKIRGDLSVPEKLEVSLRPFRLSGVRGALDWKSTDQRTSARGPLSLDATLEIDLAGKDLRTAEVKGKMDLSGLEIHQKDEKGNPLFQKPARSPLTLAFQGRKRGERIEIGAADLRLLTSEVMMKGWIAQPQKPSFDLTFRIPRYRYQDLSFLIPLLAEWKLKGSGSGQLQLSGTYDFAQGVEKSPLKLKGMLRTEIDEVRLPASSPVASSAKNAPSAPTAAANPDLLEPILPPWPVMKTLDFTGQVKIGSVHSGDLVLEKIEWDGGVKQGMLTGKTKVGKIFGGSAEIDDLKYALNERQPEARFTARVQKLDVNRAVTWLSPEWKNLVKGQGSGRVRLVVPHSSRKDFMERMQAEGEVALAHAFFSGRPIEELVNEELSKLPKIGEKAKIRAQGLASDLSARFHFRNARLVMEPFLLKLPNRSELQLKGSLGMDMSMDLTGTGYLADPPIGGMVLRANSDPQGRLIIPLEVRGKMTEPSVSFASATVEQLLARTAKHEFQSKKQEAVGSAREKVKEKASDLIQKGIGGFLKR